MPETGLRVSPDRTLPLDAVTQTFALLAVRRAGKSNAAAVMAEEMFAAGQAFVAIDPKGDRRGQQVSTDDRGILKDSVYHSADLRERVAREIGKRPDVALNGVMLIIAELYADGVSDGASFGPRSLVAEIRATRALTGEDGE